MYDRDALIAEVDLPALADELLGARCGSARSPKWRCPNPQHAQTGRTPPLSVFTSHRGEQRWRCHGCGAGGTAIDLVMTCCGTGPREAMDRLARRVGLVDHDPDWVPPTRPRFRPVPEPARGCSDPAGMDRYVNECADALFKPEGRRIRAWLNDVRRLPDDVLAANRIGADLGPRRQWRPDGMPRAGGAVLPVIEEGHAIYAQLRRIHPKPDGSRYLNPRSELAPNPRLAFLMPVEARHIELIVTEGTIDALSATTAGYRSVAVLSAAYPDRSLALRLSQLPYPIVIAFDQDEIGRKAGNRLATLLDSCQSHNVSLVIPAADLNVALVKALDIERMVKQLVERTASGRCRGPALQL